MMLFRGGKVLLVLSLLLPNAAATATTTVCPPSPFATVGTRHFYWGSPPSGWEVALVGCQENSTLAAIRDAAEMAALTAKSVAEGGATYYTSLYNPFGKTCSGPSCDQELLWLGHNFLFAQASVFGGLSADKSAGFECLAFSGGGAATFSNCATELHNFVCECDSAAGPPRACPKDLSWSRYGDKYYGPSMAERSFNASADFCRERGGRLASVATERDYIQAATASIPHDSVFYVDATNPTYSACESHSACDGVLRTTGGTALDTNTYMAAGPLEMDFSAAGPGEGCAVLMEMKKLRSERCSTDRLAFCEATCPTAAPAPPMDPSIPFATASNGLSYHASEVTVYPSHLRSYCSQLGMEVASVATQGEYDGVVEMAMVHLSTVLLVNIHNPDLKECNTNADCDQHLRDLDGNRLSTSHFTHGVDISPSSDGQSCLRVHQSSGKIEQFTCTQKKKVLCQMTPAPVDGSWGPWSDSGPCSASCGGGDLDRVRACDDPAPQGGGEECEGEGAQTVACNQHSCPPQWLSWQSWGACSRTCDYGVRRRARECSDDNSGSGCQGLGPDKDAEYCPLGQCAGTAIGTLMRPYFVEQEALEEFISSASTMFPLHTNISSSIFCTSKCLSLRSHRLDLQACNGFAVQDGLCKLGYRDPNWVLQQQSREAATWKIYFDLFFKSP